MNNDSYVQKLSDFEILKKLINKELDMNEVDNDTKMRLIALCDDRLKEVNKKIETVKRKIEKMDNYLSTYGR